MKQKISCPVCGKRIFDIENTNLGTVNVELKCLHCRKIVSIYCNTVDYEKEKINIRDMYV